MFTYVIGYQNHAEQIPVGENSAFRLNGRRLARVQLHDVPYF